MIRTQVRPEVETHLPPARSSQHRVRRQHRQPSPRAGPVGHHALGAAQEGIQGYQDKNRRGIVCPLPLCGCTVRTPPSHAAITCGTDGTGLQLPANRAAHTALMKTHLCSHRFTQGPLALALAGAMALALAQPATPGPGLGPNPQLPAPEKSGLVPTFNIAPAQGWPQGTQPQAPAGFKVTALARGLDHPRWVYTLPNGAVLVAESNKPPPAEGAKNVHSDGLRGLAMGLVMKRAGAGTPSANRITLLRDTDGDGVADVRTAFMQDLLSPFGMALMGTQLFIATADGVVKVPYEAGQTSITVAPVRVTDLPAGANHHWTKNIIASPHGRRRGPRRHLGGGCGDRQQAAVCHRPAQPQRPGLGATEQGALDGGERTRRTGQRAGARLPHLGEGRRLLRLAVELLGPACGHPCQSAQPRHGGQGHRPRLWPGLTRCAAGPGVLRRPHARRLRQRRVHRPARLVEPQGADGL